MKTDKFDDAIRRKLESIEPPFHERDWSHMQAFMHHHGFPPTWVGASQWLMPMAAAAAVTSLIVATVWQFRTNQQLSQSVQTLSRTVTRLETTQAKLIQLKTRTDTVYVTNFTKNPASTQTGPPTVAIAQPRQRESSVDRPHESYSLRTPHPPIGNRQAVGTDETISRLTPGSRQQPGINPSMPTDRLTQQGSSTRRSADQPAGAVAEPDAPAQRPAVADVNGVVRTPVKTNPGIDRTAPIRTEGSIITQSDGPDNRRLPGNPSGQTQLATGRSVSNQDYLPSGTSGTSAGRPIDRQANEPIAPDKLPAGGPSTLRSISLVVLASVRPLEIDSAYYLERMASRIRRIRSLWGTIAPSLPATTAPAEIASSRPVSAGVRVRLGVAGEISTNLQTLGAYSEVVFGKHWAIGVGLNKLNRQGGQYINDEQFERMTHVDFRQLYAPGNPLIHDITNIDRQFTIWQLPVSLSYRATLGKGLALIPSVGMNFSLSAQDNTTFTYRRGFEFPHVAGKQQNRPCESFNAYTVALGAEKSWKHLVLQAGPVLSLPTKVSPDPINPVTLGLRTRVLFQF